MRDAAIITAEIESHERALALLIADRNSLPCGVEFPAAFRKYADDIDEHQQTLAGLKMELSAAQKRHALSTTEMARAIMGA
jgi:hypothetical protein